ncbi:MAG: DUF72 domain-containing protein [bacterium]|nr:DUF72 domain-containing protein [bacterium]
MTQLLYGTAGWSYKDWNGTVYPAKKPRDFNPLHFLAQSFDFVEVNTSFYRIPSLKLTEGWVKKTETLEDFSFWMKVYQDFTHKLTMRPQEITAFKDSLAPLTAASKLSGLLAQFPYAFKLTTANINYVLQLGQVFSEYPLAVEFRHNSWDNMEVLDAFKLNQLIWVNIDQPVISQSLPLTTEQTHPEVSYVRLHGRNYKSWFSNEGRDARYDYDYRAMELNEIAAKIAKLTKLVKKIFVSGNNHYKGSAAKNLKELKARMASAS